jgi:Glyoxalase-like domain
MASGLIKIIDHLVIAVVDLDTAMARVEKRIGIKPLFSGIHPGRGTKNALLAIDDGIYLEFIAADFSQSGIAKRNWGLDSLAADRLAGWAVRSGDVAAVISAARAGSITIGDLVQGRRQTPEGQVLEWRNSNAAAVSAGGIIPFFIDWQNTPHPSASAPQFGARLSSFGARHPDPAAVNRELAILDIALKIEQGDTAQLTAMLDTAAGLMDINELL